MELATGGFAAAALKFAVGQVRDSRSRTKLAAAYEGAAEIVVNHYTGPLFPPRSEAWNAIVNLLRMEACGEALSLSGTLNEQSLAPLRFRYTQDEPPLLDILSRMIDEIAKIAKQTLSQNDRTVANLLTAKANEVRALLREQDRKLDQLGDRLEDVYEAVRSGAASAEPTTAARALPSDEDYRVERPELEELRQRLGAEQVIGIGGAVGVGGQGGVGESLLAVRYAAQEFDGDRVLYTSLDSGSARSRTVDLGLALGLAFVPEQSDIDVGRMLRDALSRFDGLLILDNADTEADVRALLPPAGSACKVVVTSRDRSLLRSVTGAEPVMLDVFDVGQARQCFAERVGAERLQQELDSVDSLCDLLGYLPLAVDVAAATIAAEADSEVSDWADAYSTESALLDQLPGRAGEDEDLGPDAVRERKIVRAVLRLSLRDLGDQARSLLSALSCFDAAAGGSEALIQAVAGVGPEGSAEVRVELNRLHQRSVLQAPTPNVLGDQRYTVHRLMREVARREAAGELERYEATFFGVFAAFPELLSRLVSDDRSNAAIMAFHEEAANLEAVAGAIVGGTPPAALEAQDPARRRAEFAANVDQFASFRWPSPFRRRLLKAGLDDARSGGWGWLEAHTLQAIGDVEMREDRLGEARARYEEAWLLYRQTEARLGEANTLKALGDLEMRESRLSDARGRYGQALPLFRRIENRLGEAATLRALGDLEMRESRLSRARGRYEQALPLFRQIEGRLGEANTLRAIGDLEMRESRLSGARGRYEQALPLFRQIEDRLGEAATLRALV